MAYEFEQFTAVRLFTSAAYSPDGKTIAYIANTTGEFNLWTMPAGGGFAKQLTSFSDRAVRSFKWSPDSSKIAFTADHHGDEMHQVYVLGTSGSWPQQLTDAADVQYSVSDWTPDGTHLVITGNDREPTEMDPQLLEVETREIKRLMTGARYYSSDVSPDGKHLTIVDFIGNTDQNIFVYNLGTGESTNATPHEGETVFWPGPWKPDGSGFYLVTNTGREYNGVGFYDLESQSWDWVYTPEADVENIVVSENGGSPLYNVNVAGGSQLRRNDGQDLLELPLGVVSDLNLSPNGDKAVLLFSKPQEAVNVYELELATGKVQALEQSMIGGLDLKDLLEPDLVHYPSFDGRDIPAWLYKPKNVSGTCPVVLSIHGGPEAQERPGYAYSGLYQYLLDRGVGVLAPNIRGSTGYGVSYQKLIHRDWGGDELKDIEHAAKYLQGLDWVDAERLAVFGGSFGGFATLSAVTRLPEYWVAGVDIVGPANLVTFAKAVPPHWRAMMKTWVGDPEEDTDFLMARSPITYFENVTVPLLVIQGANDPRVVKAESDQMVERMREKGLAVEYYVDDKSGHGPTNREERNKWYRLSADFLLEQFGLGYGLEVGKEGKREATD
ncbi:S9 family peptidase [soil metagenome]